MYIDEALKTYLDDLAARKPAPGGGSAAALAASIGVSLMSMVANYTIGNPKYKDVESKAAAVVVRTEKLRGELENLIDKDVEAYSRLSKAMKEYGTDKDRMDQVYKGALLPPYEVCVIAGESMKLCAELVDYGNRNLVTDTAIAAIMLEGAYFSAKYNVYINLKYIKDNAFIEKIHAALSPLEDEMPKLKEEILEKCEDIIQK